MKILEVHRFSMGDVDDIEIYIAEPLYKFEISDKGKWVMANALEAPQWQRINDYSTYSFVVIVVAKFTDELATFFNLKWG